VTGRLRFAEVGESDLPDRLDRNPRDGFPWIGLLMVRRAHGRHGLGRETAAASVELLGDRRCASACSTATLRRWRSGRAWAPSRWSIATTAAAWS
jgi:hypothetical protein